MKLAPYIQTTPFTTAAASLLTLLHYFEPKTKLSKENEFSIWRETVNLPTRASSIYALATIAKQHNLDPKIIVERKAYDFPDYRFHRYKKTDIEQAQFSSKLHLKKAQSLQIPIQEKPIAFSDIKKILKQNHIILLRVNAGPIRNEKNTSQYLLLHGYQDRQFQIIDPALGGFSIPHNLMKEAFQTLETKKYRNHRMIIFDGERKENKK